MTKLKENPYNYLYDKNTELASRVDHDKALYKAKKFSNVSRPKLIFENMFSDLKAYPISRANKVIKDVIPPWFLKDYASHIKNINSYLLRYDDLGCDLDKLNALLPITKYTDSRATEVDRHRFSFNPVIPKSMMLPPDVSLISMREKKEYFLIKFKEVIQPTRTIGTQTTYRESSTQTDPYSPEFLIRPGAEPEVLRLIPLSYGSGLPVGSHEIQMLERARHHREVDGMFLNNKDIGEIRKRRAALNKLEVEEWRIRESQIDELQMSRLEVLIKLMKERRENLENVHNECMMRFRKARIEHRDEKRDIVQYEFVKAIRKLLKSHKKAKADKNDKSLIQKYGDPLSVVWAPLARIGQFLDLGSERYVVDNKYLSTYNGICELEDCIPQYVVNPKIKIPKPKNYTRDGYKNKKLRLEEELTELYKHLKTKNQIMIEEKRKPLKFLIKNEKPFTRPPTPTLDLESIDERELDSAINFLITLIKGRAIQVMMYEAKEKRIELIHEVKSTHALHSEEIEMKKQEKRLILAYQRSKILFDNKESTIYSLIDGLEGESLGNMCDFLTKELIRLQEERRIHASVMMALRKRRMREAEESGLRQLEERRRREEDEIFKQIVKVNQTTVESYLDDIISDNIHFISEDVARKDIEVVANEINITAYENESERDYLGTEEIVSDLVHHFLIPEVYKTEARERMALNQKKYLLQAHREIVKATDNVVDLGTKNNVKTQSQDKVHVLTKTDDEKLSKH